jgi:hypothetical protein
MRTLETVAAKLLDELVVGTVDYQDDDFGCFGFMLYIVVVVV